MRERLSSSVGVRVFKLDYEFVLKEVKRYAEEIVEKGLAELVILFGSLAKGTYSPFSDIDLLIIVKDAPRNPLDRIALYINPKLPLDVEPRVFTLEEFFNLINERKLFGEEVLFRGILLAGSRELFEEARRRYLDKWRNRQY